MTTPAELLAELRRDNPDWDKRPRRDLTGPRSREEAQEHKAEQNRERRADR